MYKLSPTNLAEDPVFASLFSHLLETRTSINVTFVLETADGEIEVFAHQLILAMRSSYFADKFYANEGNKKNQIIRLDKINPKAFKDMIRYCYDWKPVIQTTEEACALFKVANEFQVVSLMDLCRTYLRNIKIDPGNVFSLMEISEYMQDKSLKDMCNKLLEENTREVMSTYEMRDVTPTMVHIILNLPKLSLYSEYELVKWIFVWAKVKSEEEDSSTRCFLAYLMQGMDFLSLSLEEFAMLCKNNPEFFTSHEISSIYLNKVFPGSREMPDCCGKDLRIRVYTGAKKSEMQKCKKSEINPSEKSEIEELKNSEIEKSKNSEIEEQSKKSEIERLKKSEIDQSKESKKSETEKSKESEIYESKESETDESEKLEIKERKQSEIDEWKESVTRHIEETVSKRQQIMEEKLLQMEKKIRQLEENFHQKEESCRELHFLQTVNKIHF